MNILNIFARKPSTPVTVQVVTSKKKRKLVLVDQPRQHFGSCQNELPITASLYESAKYIGSDRSWLEGFVQGSRADLPADERLELVRKSRWFDKNSAVYNKAKELLEGNVIGVEGINPSIQSLIPAYNTAAMAAWRIFAKCPSIGSADQLPDVQAKIVGCMFVDGEIFVRKVLRRGLPKVKLYESHQCVSWPNVLDEKIGQKTLKELGYTESNGIVKDADGERAYYIIAEDDGTAVSSGGIFNVRLHTPQLIPANQIIHVFEASRPGQERAVPPTSSGGMKALHDLDDTQTMELRAVRTIADVATVITLPAGEEEHEKVIDVDEPTGTVDSNGDPEFQRKYYAQQTGGKTVILENGAQHKNTDAVRPSAQMQQLWEYLTDQFCKSIGLSYAAMMDYRGGWTGAALRGAIVADNRFYSCRTKPIVQAMQEIFEFVFEIENRRIAIGGTQIPADWQTSVKWHTPRRSTVDIGYSFEATKGELAAGMNTLRDILGERGLDWKEVLTQKAQEEAFINALAAQYNIPANRISALGPNERPTAVGTPAQTTQGQVPDGEDS